MAVEDQSPIHDLRSRVGSFDNEVMGFIRGYEATPADDSIFSDARSRGLRVESLVTAWSVSLQLLELVSEHVSLFRASLDEPFAPMACGTCVRGLLEASAATCRLLDTSLDDRDRIGRVFAIRYQEMRRHERFLRATGRADEYLRVRLEKVVKEASALGYELVKDRRGRQIGLVETPPSATDIIRDVLDEERLYRLLSEVAHGMTWAIRQVCFEIVPKAPAPPEIGGVHVTSMTKVIKLPHLESLVEAMAKAYSRSVWAVSDFAGWDLHVLSRILDSGYEALDLPTHVRLWRTDTEAP